MEVNHDDVLQQEVNCRMPGFTELTLKTSTHATFLLQRFNSLREDGALLCDCSLFIEDEEFPIHKSLLAACSPYFRALFTSKMRETASSRVKIGGLSAQTFQLVLQFVYSGEVCLNEISVTQVYPAALMFQIDTLRDICRDYLVNQLCSSNCLGIWRYAQTYSDSVLKNSAWMCILSQFTSVVNGEEFVELSLSNICTLLCSDELDVESEMDVYSAAVKWLNHDLKLRKAHTLQVMSCVRFPLLSPTVLTELMSSEMPAFSCKNIKELLCQAKNAYRLRSTKSRQKMAVYSEKSRSPRKTLKTITVIGGYNGGLVKHCEAYDQDMRTWHKNELVLTNCEHVHWVGVVGVRLYAMAGPGLANINCIMSRLTDLAAEQLQSDSFTRDWECEATLPYDCSNMEFCIHNEFIYGCGEVKMHGGGLEYGITRYNPCTGTWKFLTTFHGNQPRVSFAFVAHGNRLYLIGGMDITNGAPMSNFESYNLTTNAWEVLESLNTARYNVGAGVSLSNCIYAVGGYEYNDNVCLDTVEYYSLDSKKWLFTNPLPSPRASMACCTWRGDLYCIGGETSGAIQTKDVFKFDMKHGGQWTEVGSLSSSRIYPKAIIL